MQRSVRIGTAALALLAAARSFGGPFSYVSESEKLDAVSSRVFGGYVRVRAADGAFRPETYVFGNGGQVGGSAIGMDLSSLVLGGSIVGSVVADPTIDGMSFSPAARDIRAPLAAERYLPAGRPAETNLLIMVYWGRSFGGRHIGDGALRDAINARNAALMGFDADPAMMALHDVSLAFWGRPFRAALTNEVHGRVLSALETDRYFVILRAFDFQTAWKQRKIRLLWETRFSLSERANAFDEALPGMALAAARYFGRDTNGLMLDPVPDGRVDIGEVKSLGTLPLP